MVLMNSVLLNTAIDRCKKGSLDEAILLATLGHFGQVDRGGAPYILHAMAVMARVATHGTRTQVMAVLHDLIEDNPHFTVEILRGCGFDEEILEGLGYLVRPPGTTILQAAEKMAALDVRRAAVVMAMRTKIADYEENRRLSRIPDPTQRDIDMTLIYGQAHRIVSRALAKAP